MVSTCLYICMHLIDYSKSFDCVSHKKMWTTIKEMNFETKLILLLESLYNKQKAVVRLESSNSESFDVSKGVRHGCILFPHLFSLYTEGNVQVIVFIKNYLFVSFNIFSTRGVLKVRSLNKIAIAT